MSLFGRSNTGKSDASAAKAETSIAPIAPENDVWPSVAFTNRANAILSHRTELELQIKSLEKKLATMNTREGRAALEVAGKDPDVEIRRLNKEIAQCRSQIGSERNEAGLVAGKELERRSKIRDAMLARWRKATADQLASHLSEIARLLDHTATESPLLTAMTEFDEAGKKFNELVQKSSGAGNRMVRPEDNLRGHMTNMLKQVIQSAKIVPTLNRLRAAVGLGPLTDKPAPPVDMKQAEADHLHRLNVEAMRADWPSPLAEPAEVLKP